MAINSVSAGSYNSPSVQAQPTVDRTEERRVAVSAQSEAQRTKAPETQASPTVNTSGQSVGTLISVQA
jgi:hypothetical protein